MQMHNIYMQYKTWGECVWRGGGVTSLSALTAKRMEFVAPTIKLHRFCSLSTYTRMILDLGKVNACTVGFSNKKLQAPSESDDEWYE